MFESKRYITKGVSESIPLDIQLYIWGMIEIQKGQGLELDYLQVFKLEPVLDSDGRLKQQITHSQEEPDRKVVAMVPSEDIITEKIFVIDNEEYVTMLLSSEY